MPPHGLNMKKTTIALALLLVSSLFTLSGAGGGSTRAMGASPDGNARYLPLTVRPMGIATQVVCAKRSA
jgi:hypothetical protein